MDNTPKQHSILPGIGRAWSELCSTLWKQTRQPGIVWLLCMALLYNGLAWGLGPTDEQMRQGYSLLGQAHSAAQPEQRERLLAAAIESFKEAYQQSGSRGKVQALLGAAQSYLLQQQSPRRFPFLWQPTPVQRAERSLIQALVLHPNDGAAALLLGIVYHRLAALAATPASHLGQQRDKYFRLAAAQGLPLRQSPAAGCSGLSQAFDTNDAVLALQYMDARGTGQADDLLFVYRSTEPGARLFAVVVANGHCFPLITDASTGSLASAATLTGVSVQSQSSGRPLLNVLLSQDHMPLEESFLWENTGFMYLGQHPLGQ